MNILGIFDLGSVFTGQCNYPKGTILYVEQTIPASAKQNSSSDSANSIYIK